ncbi:carbohydrate kinase family protein [Beggiatoa leptomitoformis]|uniref:Carbohydrate kinase family protein n=1 Tax=Beggiatoa leptomitoformis TaxID=288004 RepID=A0A2N9YIW1_9GAMM|nr:carbohydrate kinase family protein [Beggiatoa leptomitoformis]ALG67355.1 carbohydrate kinase family protein [Beggiatoa leptomitoformis]AUI70440.1 carbohydrate kinase family protein [Beggiatoa leptomitoformis]
MSALICGSFAFDTIMVFKDQFKNHILPEKVHILNVSFLVPDMRREFGGCAGNIAYNLKLLGGDPLPMATVGTDFSTYSQWMDTCKIARTHVKTIENSYTGQAFITTDMDDNQITAFHPGAMSYSHQNKVSDAQGVTIGIISPDGRDGMIEHAKQFAEADIPFIFDPGQGMPMFNGDDLKNFIEQATWVTVNDYEWELMRDRTGLSPQQVAERTKGLIVTKGGEGSTIYTQEKTYQIPCVKASSLVDPTGCGDAFRGGLLYGLMNGMDWETTGRIASLIGTIKIESNGTQNHRFTLDEFKQRFASSFGYELAL